MGPDLFAPEELDRLRALAAPAAEFARRISVWQMDQTGEADGVEFDPVTPARITLTFLDGTRLRVEVSPA